LTIVIDDPLSPYLTQSKKSIFRSNSNNNYFYKITPISYKTDNGLFFKDIKFFEFFRIDKTDTEVNLDRFNINKSDNQLITIIFSIDEKKEIYLRSFEKLHNQFNFIFMAIYFYLKLLYFFIRILR
jgi:hypothetical protein